MAQFEALLRQTFAGSANCRLSRWSCCYGHYQLLTRWNQVLNLSSIRDSGDSRRPALLRIALPGCQSACRARIRLPTLGLVAVSPGFP